MSTKDFFHPSLFSRLCAQPAHRGLQLCHFVSGFERLLHSCCMLHSDNRALNVHHVQIRDFFIPTIVCFKCAPLHHAVV